MFDVTINKEKNQMVITVPINKNPGFTRHDAKSAEKANCAEGDPKNWRLFSSGGFATCDAEHRKRPIKIGINVIAEVTKEDRKALIEAED